MSSSYYETRTKPGPAPAHRRSALDWLLILVLALFAAALVLEVVVWLLAA